jgi:glycosyltransferase involved in cell wall biosynthesis
MRILIVHNRYQHPGGEDAVARTEFDILKNSGEQVRFYERSNEEFNNYSLSGKMVCLWKMGFSKASYRDMRKILKEFRPDVVHFHNIFFILTPAVYQACRDEGVAVVQSLHNFRLLCSNALFFRDGKVCEECLEHKNLWRGVYHGCYKNSRLISAFVVRMLRDHWKRKTWLDKVDFYITATEFSRHKYIEAGIPGERIIVKPNIDHEHSLPETQDQGYALFAGRLSEEKGVKLLIKAWARRTLLPLKIIGGGPLAAALKKEAAGITGVEILGFVSKEEYDACMRGAKFVIVPSICYENFPRVIVEAYSWGVPVLASSLGGFPEIVQEEQTGLLFRPGDTDDLLEKIKWFVSGEDRRSQMQEHIREIYRTRYSTRKNYELLMDIYSKAVAGRAAGRS